MFKRAIVSAFILAAGLISTQANAAFVATDWQAEGDESSTLDTNTGLEWLDLTVTKAKSYSDVSALLSGTLKGWRFPTSAELDTLISSFSLPTSSIEREEMFDLFFSLFGVTYIHANEGMASHIIQHEDGLFYRTSVSKVNKNVDGSFYTVITRSSASIIGFDSNSIPKSGAYFLVSDGGTTLSSINNPMLNINNPNAPVNQVPDAPADVPAHAGFGLLGLLLMAFGIRRRKSL